MTEEPDIECTKCGTMVNWLAVFPGDICLDCHAQKTSTLSADELLDQVMNVFGAKPKKKGKK